MNDLTALAIISACLLATLALIHGCDKLRPPASSKENPR